MSESRVSGGGKAGYGRRSMDGQTVPIDQPFVTPEGHLLMHPGDRSKGAPAGTMINCRRVVVGID
jgi:hypothetical protein